MLSGERCVERNLNLGPNSSRGRLRFNLEVLDACINEVPISSLQRLGDL